ncbi:hypothetical protein HO133_008937 [Letharia lupina]|uniref:Uncharacterized protein n=1 Tax=Letharia lupina TaxID=560253 RepID=A0A8H6CMD0_9LECA|nr:uncharacterized protein HO133_008937 [Letharia lupina]KAF6226073.1 hypothetical protein HO133_008937 [Letharia lupina]
MIGPEWLPRLAAPSKNLKIPPKPFDYRQNVPPLENSVSMQPDLQAQIDQALFDYDNMALPAPKIGDQFQKINDALMELTRLLFPIDPEMACELVKEQYRCEMQ